MKKYITILFLAAYLSSSTQLIEVLKLPLLIEHYFEHKAENQNITFIQFIKLHYSENQHYEQHHKEKQLPFKAISQANFNAIAIHKTNFIETVSSNRISNPILKHTVHYSSKYISYYKATIWQPPRIY